MPSLANTVKDLYAELDDFLITEAHLTIKTRNRVYQLLPNNHTLNNICCPKTALSKALIFRTNVNNIKKSIVQVIH